MPLRTRDTRQGFTLGGGREAPRKGGRPCFQGGRRRELGCPGPAAGQAATAFHRRSHSSPSRHSRERHALAGAGRPEPPGRVQGAWEAGLPRTPAVGAPERGGAPDGLDGLKRKPGERARGSLGPKPSADPHPPQRLARPLPSGRAGSQRALHRPYHVSRAIPAGSGEGDPGRICTACGAGADDEGWPCRGQGPASPGGPGRLTGPRPQAGQAPLC